MKIFRDLMHTLAQSHALDFDYVQNGKLVVHTVPLDGFTLH